MFTIINLTLFSQSIKRHSLNSGGGTGYGEGFYLKQTTGQSSNTEIVNGDKTIVRQGFQQPQLDLSKIKTCESCDLLLYPNPLISESTLNIPLKTKTYNIWVCDLLGRVLSFEKDLSTAKVTLSSLNFPPGQYIIRVLYENGCSCITKLIVTK